MGTDYPTPEDVTEGLKDGPKGVRHVGTTDLLAARRTRFFAAAYAATICLAAACNLLARAVWNEPLAPWLTGLCVVLLVGWSGVLSGRVWAWWALVGVYGVLTLTSAVTVRILSSQSTVLEDAVLFEFLFPVGILWGIWVVLPLLALATDRPANWRPRAETRVPAAAAFARRTAVLIAPILALMAFWLYLNPPARNAQADDIREAVLRHQFEHHGSGLQKTGGAYYISLRNWDIAFDAGPVEVFTARARFLMFGEHKDPSDRFLARFRNSNPPVMKASACTPGVGGVRDRRSGRRGLVLMVGNVKWIRSDLVEVKGGYYEGGLSASGNTYRVARKNGRWVVVSDRMDWIS